MASVPGFNCITKPTRCTASPFSRSAGYLAFETVLEGPYLDFGEDAHLSNYGGVPFGDHGMPLGGIPLGPWEPGFGSELWAPPLRRAGAAGAPTRTCQLCRRCQTTSSPPCAPRTRTPRAHPKSPSTPNWRF